MSKSPSSLPPGVYLSGFAVGEFELVEGKAAKTGKPYRKVVGRLVAGELFVKVTEFLDDGEQPVLFRAGEPIQADVTGVDTYNSSRDVLAFNAVLTRPVVGEAKK